MALQRRRKYTVSQAKNFMRRTVGEILERSPSNQQVRELWAHFGGRCAYCGKQLAAQARDWHLDHADAGRGNHAGNRVLACGICNGDEKREQGWREFLSERASAADFAQREALIRAWLERNTRDDAPHTPEVTRVLGEIEVLIEQFATSCTELKMLRRLSA